MPRAVVCQSGDGRLSLDGTGFASDSTVKLVSGSTEYVATSVTVNAGGTHLDAVMPSGVAATTTYDVVVENGSCSDATPHLQVTAVSGAFAFLADPDHVWNGVSTGVNVYGAGLSASNAAASVSITPTGGGSATTLQFKEIPNHPNRVQAVVPEGQSPGTYDLALTDGAGCSSSLANAISVTADLTVGLLAPEPNFGDANAYTSVTVRRDTSGSATTTFQATPRLFLNPENAGPTDVAITLESVAYVDDATLTAIVPPGHVAGWYDLVLVNPDGSVGNLGHAFHLQSTPPPVIANVTPSSIVNATGQKVTIAGTSFSADATVTVSCKVGTVTSQPTVTVVAPTCTTSGCAMTATIDASTLTAGTNTSAGDVCLLRVTNGDGSYFDYSAIGVTGPSLNLVTPTKGTDLNFARRALVAASGNATASARFVYAIGGDDGATPTATSRGDVEIASVTTYGALGAWSLASNSPLTEARSFAASATIGRYVYVLGGRGATALASAERAMILDPVEAPHVDVGDMVPDASTGLAAGTYVYRVAALYDATDVDNPGGETLASDELSVRVPAVDGKKVKVVLAVTAPRDRLGQTLPGVVGYRVYRSPTGSGVSGDSVFLGTIPSGSATFTDDGAATPGTEKPLPLGSLGKWRTLPTMGIAREGLGGAAARDPSDPTKYYVYALLGRDDQGTLLDSYEYLPITVAPNGHQTYGAAFVAGSKLASTKRWQIGSWVADATVSSSITGSNTYVYLGGGLGAGTQGNAVDAGLVQAGGDLGTLTLLAKSFTASRAGYGVCAANDQLFAFGGLGGAPSSGAASAKVSSAPPELQAGAWNNEGITMTALRYLMGSAVQSAFIFLVGGTTDTTAATKSTELVIW